MVYHLPRIILINKKKRLILIEWFAPGYKAGGPIQSCVNICRALHTQYDIFVLTSDTDHGETAPYPGKISNQWITDGAVLVEREIPREGRLPQDHHVDDVGGPQGRCGVGGLRPRDRGEKQAHHCRTKRDPLHQAPILNGDSLLRQLAAPPRPKAKPARGKRAATISARRAATT